MTDRLPEIEGRLQRATPGPWVHDAHDSGHSRYEVDRYVVTPDTGDTICDLTGLVRSHNEKHAKDDGGADAEFIANAPTDITALLGAVKEVRELANYLDTLAPGDQHYAKLIRAAISKHVEGK